MGTPDYQKNKKHIENYKNNHPWVEIYLRRKNKERYEKLKVFKEMRFIHLINENI